MLSILKALSPQTIRFSAMVAVLTALFSPQLYRLVTLSLSTDLHSHLVLIPVVSLYFAWINRLDLPPSAQPRLIFSLIPGIAAAALLAVKWASGNPTPLEDELALTTASFIMLIWSAAGFCFDPKVLKAQFFPLAFLALMVPLPTLAQDWINLFFQHTSAEASSIMLSAADVAVFRPQPLVFQLSTIEIYVAPSCSGIRSSLVLFITSIVAGELFLKSKWKRWALVLFIVPLAIVRNAFRISTIAYLCVHVGPHMIDHWIHHKGGPFFFALSMIPFLGFLFWLWKTENRKSNSENLDSQPID